MKVIRKKGDPNAPAAAPAAPAVANKPKVLNRAPPPAVVSKEEQDSRKIAALLGRLTLGEHDEHCDGHTDLAGVIQEAGFASLQANGLLTKLRAEAEDMSNADAREGALLAFSQLCEEVGRPCEPYVVPLLPVLLERLSDKVPAVREAAMQAALALVQVLCPHAVELVLPGEQEEGGCYLGSSSRVTTGCCSKAACHLQRQVDTSSSVRGSTTPDTYAYQEAACSVHVVGSIRPQQLCSA
jgi:hypothetical protein